MASLNTSEFQFGMIFFAKFNQLFNYGFNRVIIPNQIQEGNPRYTYNGADIVLDEYFLQVKMSSRISWTWGNPLSSLVPYFKFRVYNTVKSKSNLGQLDVLKLHSNDDAKKVYYVAPCFDSNYTYRAEYENFWCDCFYRSNPNNISDFVTFIDIASINNTWIEKNNNHFICYKNVGNAYFLSDAKEIKKIAPLTSIEETLSKTGIKENFTINDILRQRIQELKKILGDIFFENDKYDIDNVGLYALQKIYLAYFNTIWLPIIIPEMEIRRMKMNKIRNNI